MVFRKSISALNIIFLLFFGLFVLYTSGCEKKEAIKTKPPRITGPCEIYDKLPEDIAKSLDVNFGNKVKLLGITTSKLSENQIKLTYYWQLLDDLESYDVVFVHFTDSDNNVLFQNDHDFCQRRTFLELKNKFIKEPFLVNVPKSSVGKEIFVKIGMYSIEPDIGRLKIESAGGVPTDQLNTRATVDKIKL